MPPPPFCIHCRQPVHDGPDGTVVHARSGNAPCADGQHLAEREA